MVGKLKKGSFENKKKAIWKPKQSDMETNKISMETKKRRYENQRKKAVWQSSLFIWKVVSQRKSHTAIIRPRSHGSSITIRTCFQKLLENL